jgi:transposase
MLAKVVEALRALRGIQLLTAATIMVEVGELRRFDNPRQLLVYLALVPGERSTGDSVRHLGITKAGDARVRRVLVESAWAYPETSRTMRGRPRNM